MYSSFMCGCAQKGTILLLEEQHISGLSRGAFIGRRAKDNLLVSELNMRWLQT